ncbi:MAG: glycoside hydrolase [Thermoplasmata archaeon]|nr:glycoside hydrolase [Thermoplasmata archaeon]
MVCLASGIAVLMALPPFVGAAAAGQPATRDVDVGHNFEVGAGVHPDWTKREPTIAVDPRNPQILAAAEIDGRLVPGAMPSWGHHWLAYYRSTDGGQTWTGGLIPGFPGDNSSAGRASPLRAYNFSADPMVQFDRAGNLYLSGGALQAGTPGTILNLTNACAGSAAMFVAKYSQDGAHYVRESVVFRGCGDYPRLAVDVSAGATSGNVYEVVSTNASTYNGTSAFFRSTDGGRTFAQTAVLNGSVPMTMTVSGTGAAVVATSACQLACPYSVHPQLIYVSTDGGRTFGSPAVAVTENLGPLPVNNTISGPGVNWLAADGRTILLAYDDFNGSQWFVKLVRSTDGGVTWSAPVNVSDDPRDQHMWPTIAVSHDVIGIAWYDSRNGQLANGVVDGLDVYFAQSTDGGHTFSKNVRVSSVTSNPNLVDFADANQPISYFVWFGDYITIAATPHGWHVIWTDNRNACAKVSAIYGCVDQDIYQATVTG